MSELEAWECSGCGGCVWLYDTDPECVTRWCDDCSREYNPGDEGYPHSRTRRKPPSHRKAVGDERK